MSVHHGQGRRLFPLSMQELLLLLSSSILFSLDQATPFLPVFVGPCSPDFFSLGFLHGFPVFWSAVLKLSCQLATAEQCERIISATAASVPLCTLQRGVHLFLWQGVTARDDILGLRIKMLSWRTLSLSSFSFSVCTVDYFCLRIVLRTCPCEFCSFQTIFLICQDHLNSNFIPLYIWGVFTPWHCVKTYEHMFLSVPQAVVVENQSKALCRAPFWPQNIRSCSLHTATQQASTHP